MGSNKKKEKRIGVGGQEIGGDQQEEDYERGFLPSWTRRKGKKKRESV
jgi:hypothetical protein